MFTIPENYDKYIEYLPIFGLALLVSFLLTPIAGFIARKLKIMTLPPSMRAGRKLSDFRHLEKQPTVLMGGTAVIIPFLVMVLLNVNVTPQVGALLVGTGILLTMGIIDERLELNWKAQIGAQILAALIICLSPINLSIVSGPIGEIIDLDKYEILTTLGEIPIHLVLPGDILLFGWILVCINAVKWVSGSDGLMEGNSLIAAIVLFLLSVRIQDNSSATISIIFAGLILGFLFFNYFPAKLESGSSGKSTYGFILAVLSVLSSTKLATAMIILMLPLMDFAWVIVTRIKVHKPKRIFEVMAISDQNHLHHKLLRVGLSERQVAVLEYTLTGIFGAAALAVTGAMKAFFVILIPIIAGILIFLITMFSKRGDSVQEATSEKEKSAEESPESKYSY